MRRLRGWTGLAAALLGLGLAWGLAQAPARAQGSHPGTAVRINGVDKIEILIPL